MTIHFEKDVGRIANAIVDYVERADGPVTLCEINREIPGFAQEAPPSWGCHRQLNGRVAVYWTGMTKAGAAALDKVMFTGKVAIQPTSIAPYLLTGGLIDHDDWQPVLLLPAKAANLATPQALFCLPQASLANVKMNPSWRQLTPGPMAR